MILSGFFGCIVLSKCNFQLRAQNDKLHISDSLKSDSLKQYRKAEIIHCSILSKQNIEIFWLKKDTTDKSFKLKKYEKRYFGSRH